MVPAREAFYERGVLDAPTVHLARSMLALAGLLALAAPTAAGAAEPSAGPATEIRAAVTYVEPFVIDHGGRPAGFAIDVWNEVAARLNLRTTFQVRPDVPGVLEAIRSGEADASAICLFYTRERDREFDFSYPVMNTGLQVMVRDTGEGLEQPIQRFLKVLFTRGMLLWLLGAILLIVLPAHVLWWLERRQEDGAIPHRKYIPGIFHAMVWSAEALVGWAAKMPRHGLARVLGVLWLYVGVVFVAVLTASLTTNMTVQSLGGVVNGPDDLPGKKVGAVQGTTAVEYLRDAGARLQVFPTGDAMYAALDEGKVDAVVWGAAILRYHETHVGAGRVRTVGPEFRKADLGFVVPLDSPLRKRISSAIVAMQEDGSYRRIYAHWFGGD